MIVTVVLAVMVTAELLCMLIAGAAFIQDRKYFTSALEAFDIFLKS